MIKKILVCVLIFFLFYTGAASDDNPDEKFSLSSGRGIYVSNCAGCHGEKGDGSGLKGAFNFTNNEVMISKNSSEFFNAVTNGVPGSAMPSFQKLSLAQRWNVAAFLWTFWLDSSAVEKGKPIFQANCAACHGIRGDGSGIKGAMDFTNVTAVVQKDPIALFNSISNGVEGTSMPSWKASLREDERWDAVKYIMTFQFNDYSSTRTISVPTDTENAASGEKWYSSTSGRIIIAVSILLAIAVLYMFGKGMRER